MGIEQKVEYISVADLILWTENPRDSVDIKATDEEIIRKAINDDFNNWELNKLAKEMGGYYDFSELPTVVYKNKKPVVYDGNRRVALAKIKLGLVELPKKLNFNLPNVPSKIPCNVCSEEIAIKNVYRKHSDSGSWSPLERDIFLHKFMQEEKSLFLKLDELTGLISGNNELNKVFVKNEVFNKENLSRLGFTFKEGVFYSFHDPDEGKKVLEDITTKIKNKNITTRKNRGKVVEVLEPSTQAILDKNKNNTLSPFSSVKPKYVKSAILKSEAPKVQRQTQRTAKTQINIFDKKLFLQSGDVSNLYRDIVDLYSYYLANKKSLSGTFPALIRMSLRLLCETAAKNDNNRMLKNYIETNFDLAKSNLTQDQKTTLSNHNVTEKSIIQLLHTGAHNYTASQSLDQTLALSLIIGEMLTLTYGRDKK